MQFFHKLFQDIQAARQPEIEAVQAMQLSEWRKVAFISQPGVPYLGIQGSDFSLGSVWVCAKYLVA